MTGGAAVCGSALSCGVVQACRAGLQRSARVGIPQIPVSNEHRGQIEQVNRHGLKLMATERGRKVVVVGRDGYRLLGGGG